MEKIKQIISNLNSLSLPATILIASFVIGGFYYGSQVSKQNSIENQKWAEIQAKKDAELADYSAKVSCAYQAEESAKTEYQDTCTYDCKSGYYYTADYDSYYKGCLRKRGRE